MNKKLAEALEALQLIQERSSVVQANLLTREHRELLKKSGFIELAYKSWYYIKPPHVKPGDTTPWMTSFWSFCQQYCNERFSTAWHLSPEDSLKWHSLNRTVPKQVLVLTQEKSNKIVNLPFQTSLFPIFEKAFPSSNELQEIDGIRVLSLEFALLNVLPDFFEKNVQLAQQMLFKLDVEKMAILSIEKSKVRPIGRIIAGLKHIGLSEKGEDIASLLKRSNVNYREENPFQSNPEPLLFSISSQTDPLSDRLVSMWSTMRNQMIDLTPAPLSNIDPAEFLEKMESIYVEDAYHSLSIEGYLVTPELIEKVRNGTWKPEDDEEDKKHKNALAARGYWLAFQNVRDVVGQIVAGENASQKVAQHYRSWKELLFQPSVDAGIISPTSNIGFRRSAVFLSGSRHLPPRYENVSNGMETLMRLIQKEENVFVKATLGHFLLGYIHPFSDGNGRTARFLMNTLLSEGPYPWTVVKVDDRKRYIEGLEIASTEGNIIPFAEFIAEQVEYALKKYVTIVPLKNVKKTI